MVLTHQPATLVPPTNGFNVADIFTHHYVIAEEPRSRVLQTGGASIRVGRDSKKAGKGYFEGKRLASNIYHYVVTSMIAEITNLWKP